MRGLGATALAGAALDSVVGNATRSLMHFDNGLDDVSGGGVAVFSAGPHIVDPSPVFGAGWLANGGGGLRVTPSAWIWGSGEALTLEAWVSFSENESQFVFGVEEAATGVMRFGIARLRVGATTYHWYCGPTLSAVQSHAAGVVQHIAISRPVSGYPYFHIDGIDMGNVSWGSGIPAGALNIVIGALGPGGMDGPYSFGPFTGQMDEFRASSVIRYARGNFLPPPPPFELD